VMQAEKLNELQVGPVLDAVNRLLPARTLAMLQPAAS